MKRPKRRLRAGQYFARGVAFLVFIAIVGTVRSVFALNALSQARAELIDQLGPTALAANDIAIAMLDQETGLRGYVLSGEETFLDPFNAGRTSADAALERLEAQLRFDGVAELRPEIEEIAAAARDWELNFADPTIADARANPGGSRVERVEAGKAQFDRFRAAVTHLNERLGPARADGRQALRDNARIVRYWVIFTGVVILLSLAFVAWTLRRQMIFPLQRLAGRVRDVARGDYDREVTSDGAAEVVELAEDVEAMRARIVAELAALQVAEADLRRSNQELEQFAYVASHDLQEPLRKVASFCQLLQQRYGGQLDDRADQYIAFAVDGAQRMQDLINDLLAFSRVGRMEQQPHSEVDCGALVERVRSDLSRPIEESGATIVVDGPLPTVSGDGSLLRVVFQNLIGNALKFRREAAPRVELSVARDGAFWRFRVADNGIGIDAEYAERIFVIFQRLHPRTQYEGTGIGLAMCRKIVEYHGGRMWLDTDAPPGAGSTFYFTLPADPESR